MPIMDRELSDQQQKMISRTRTCHASALASKPSMDGRPAPGCSHAASKLSTRSPPRSVLLVPTTLASLFGGVIENPLTLARHKHVVSEESLYMELLAAEHSEEEPDAGAQEGFRDDYKG